MAIGTLSIDLVAKLASLQEGMDKAARLIEKQTAAMSKSFADVATVSRNAAVTIGSAFAGVSLGVVVKDAVELADAYSGLQARIKLVSGSTYELETATNALLRISQMTRTGFSQTADLYASLTRSTKTLGVSQEEVVRVTESINKALTISGGSAESAAAALVQLGQGFASGVLRGEELNSVLEQAPRLAQAIADGMNVPLGQLRQLGAAGELTASKVFSALQKSADVLDREFSKIPVTVSGAMTQASNSVLSFVGVLDQAGGASRTFASGITFASSALDEITAQFKLAQDEGRNLGETFLRITKFGALLGLNFGETHAEAISRISADVERLNGLIDAGNLSEERRNRLVSQRAGLQQQLKLLNVGAPAGQTPDTGPTFDQREAQASLAYGTRVAAMQAAAAALTKQYATETEKLAIALKEARDKAGEFYTPELEAKIRASFAKSSVSLAKPTLEADISALQNALQVQTNAYRNAESVTEALHQAGLLKEGKYYSEKRAFIELDEAAQTRAIEAENERYRASAASGKDRIENEKKIAENEARLAQLRQNNAAKAKILDIQELASKQAVTASLEKARSAAEAYLAAMAKQGQRSIAAVGQSDKQRSYSSGLSQIEDRYEQQRQELESERRVLEAQKDQQGNSLFTDAEQQKYTARLAIIAEFQEKAIASYSQTFDAITAEEGKWENGASRAFQNYLDVTANTAKMAEDAFTKAFGSMEDAVASFAVTGKLDFKSLADSIIQDLVRIGLRAKVLEFTKNVKDMGGLGNFFKGLFGTLTSADIPDSALAAAGWAKGGAFEGGVRLFAKGDIFNTPTAFGMAGGQMGIMGEAGPEAIMPLTRGKNGKLGVIAQGGGGNSQVNHVTYNIGSNLSRQEVAANLQLLSKHIDTKMAAMFAKNGLRYSL